MYAILYKNQNCFIGISSPMVTSYYIMDIWIVETDPNNSTSYLDLHEGELCVANKVFNQCRSGIFQLRN